MYLTEREKENLFIVVAANLAKERRRKGIKLSYPEAVALITFEVMEGARAGKSVPELEQLGTKVLSQSDVMEGVQYMVKEIDIEATFADGTKLVTVYNPIMPKAEEHQVESHMQPGQQGGQQQGGQQGQQGGGQGGSQPGVPQNPQQSYTEYQFNRRPEEEEED